MASPCHTPKVEKDKNCQKWLHEIYPTTCLFPDVLDLIENEVSDHQLLNPAEVKFKKSAYCTTHGKKCKFPLGKNTWIVLGAPCVLFSKFIRCN